MTLGIRDTYQIDAFYNMTELDVCHQGRFYDSIGILILPTTGRYFQMPYSAMVPKSVFNLLIAGRIKGGDKIGHTARRNMMCCTVSGQGVGAAAAISVKHGLSFRNMDIDLL